MVFGGSLPIVSSPGRERERYWRGTETERETERQGHRDRGQREGDGVRGNTHETANIFKFSQTFYEESKKKPANKTKGKKCF